MFENSELSNPAPLTFYVRTEGKSIQVYMPPTGTNKEFNKNGVNLTAVLGCRECKPLLKTLNKNPRRMGMYISDYKEEVLHKNPGLMKVVCKHLWLKRTKKSKLPCEKFVLLTRVDLPR